MKLGAGLLARVVDLTVVLSDVQFFPEKRCPLQDLIQRRNFRIFGIHLRAAGDGAQAEAPALLQSDGRTLVGDHGLRRVHDGLQHALQVQRRGNLMADRNQRFQNFHLAFGLEKAGVMKRARGGFAERDQQGQIILVETLAVHAVDDFRHAHQVFAIDHGGGHQGKSCAFFDPGIALLDARIIARVNQHGFAALRNFARNASRRVLNGAVRDSWIDSRAAHQQQVSATLHHPKIHRLNVQDFPELGGYDGQQFVHFQRGVQDFFYVVKLRDAGNRTQVRIPFALIAERRSDGHCRRLDQLEDRRQRRFLQGKFEGSDFDGSDQGVLHDQRNIC